LGHFDRSFAHGQHHHCWVNWVFSFFAFSFSLKIVRRSSNGNVGAWDIKSQSESVIAVSQLHKDIVWGVAFSQDGTKFVTASDDKTITLCDLYRKD
jgi:WD40 repeat protein